MKIVHKPPVFVKTFARKNDCSQISDGEHVTFDGGFSSSGKLSRCAPFPRNTSHNSNTRENAPGNAYCLTPDKTLRGLVRKHSFTLENPLSPDGQTHEVVEYSTFTPVEMFQDDLTRQHWRNGKTSYQKAWVKGDVFEVRECFDEYMNPRYSLYDYSLGKRDDTLDTVARQTYKNALALWVKDYVDALADEQRHADRDEPLAREPRELTPEEREQNRKKSLSRARLNARNLIEKNRFSMMWTLTFSPKPENDVDRAARKAEGIDRFLSLDDQKDRKSVHKAWNTFLSQFRLYCKKHQIPLTWLKVLEPHDSEHTSDEKRGTYHIHIASHLKIDKRVIQDLWGYGNVWFTDFSRANPTRENAQGHVDRAETSLDPSSYICKYLGKDFDEAMKHKEKLYTTSRNVKRPRAIRDAGAIRRKYENPLTAFDIDGMNPAILKKLKALTSLESLRWALPDVGFGPGVYQTCHTEKDRETGEMKEVKGFMRISRFDARLLLPHYRKRYNIIVKKREEKMQILKKNKT